MTKPTTANHRTPTARLYRCNECKRVELKRSRNRWIPQWCKIKRKMATLYPAETIN